MILQALSDYYERLKNSEDTNISDFGFGIAKIHFVLILNSMGDVVQVQDIRDKSNSKVFPKELEVPEAVIRSSGIVPNFLWDNSQYVLGFTMDTNTKKIKFTFDKFNAFREFHHQLLGNIKDVELNAILYFLDKWNPENYSSLEYFEEIALGANLTFRLDGKKRYVFENKIAKELWNSFRHDNVSDFIATCLVTGEKEAIAKLHNPIKGVKGTASSGGRLVSFNADAFLSYGKKQSYNAPVSVKAMFQYTTALNKLLHPTKGNNFKLNDTTVVFWTEKPSKVETIFGYIFNPPEDNELIKNLSLYFKAINEGKRPFEVEGKTRFYILGLSPNRSRISVRFFLVDTVENIDRNIEQHFRDMEIIKMFDNDPDIYYIGIWKILREFAIQGDIKNISPLLEGNFLKSILTGNLYPESLFVSLIERIRTDHRINYIRAALIKAVICRKSRLFRKRKEELMELNKESQNVAYRLGRLFAVLEKVQQAAIGNANSTITDRFYSTASSSPRTVFPQLLRLSQHHMSKVDSGGWYSKLIEDILESVKEFPAFLNLENQGFFALGYYHQKKALYTKSRKGGDTNE